VILGKRGESTPNLLFVFADQWRAHALGCTGDTQVKTPNLDGLAEEGVLFTKAYSSNPVCSPCRSSIITGRFPHQTGVITNKIQLRDGEVSIAEVLRDMGYETGYIGKWHLDGTGRGVPGQGDYTPPSGYVPPGWRRQGFEFWAGFNRGHFYWDSHYWRDSPEAVDMTGTYEPDYQTDIAVEFIQQNRQGPFYLFVSWGPPHTPLTPPKEYAALYDAEEIELRPNVPPEEYERARAQTAAYYAMITSLDHNLGRMLETLKDLGIKDNTIVAFTTDHGDLLGSHGHYRKGRPLDESSHVPFIVRYPEAVQAGQRVDSPVSSVDIMPTLLSLCGAPIPEPVQGVDLSGLVTSKRGPEPESIYMEGRMGRPEEWRAVRKDSYMLSINASIRETEYLFDMKGDPYQMENLAGRPEYAEVEGELRSLLFRWAERTGDPVTVGRGLPSGVSLPSAEPHPLRWSHRTRKGLNVARSQKA